MNTYYIAVTSSDLGLPQKSWATSATASGMTQVTAFVTAIIGIAVFIFLIKSFVR